MSRLIHIVVPAIAAIALMAACTAPAGAAPPATAHPPEPRGYREGHELGERGLHAQAARAILVVQIVAIVDGH